ncbi:uncharacterized protein [Dysidea avara]|uniref:uncharacterized protein n=1 Tax=Dysidea avara TaxID=196820 RepID=UPI00332E1F13
MRSRLYCRRFKAVRTEEERIAWLQLCDDYMTEESDDEVEGVVRRHQLSWASDELQELKATLDQRILEADTISGRFRYKPRVDSTLSALPPPLGLCSQCSGQLCSKMKAGGSMMTIILNMMKWILQIS